MCMAVSDVIRDKLVAAFSPILLNIEDESHLHAGHAGSSPEGETHFRIKIVASAFEGLSRLERQRMVYRVLSEEMANRVHALALSVDAP